MSRFRVLKALLVTIAAICAVGLVASLVIRAYGAHRLASASKRYEREVGSLSLNDFARPRIAAEKNAVTWLRPGVLAAVYFADDTSLVGSLSAKRFPTWTAEETAKLEAILERNEPAITLLERSRGMKATNWDISYELGTTAKIPNLLAAINAAKMLNARGRLALGRGDTETALTSAETLGALARSHEAESETIVLLIGLAIEKLQIALVRELAHSSFATSAELDRIEASLCDEELTRAVRRSLRYNATASAHDLDVESKPGDSRAVILRPIAGALDTLVATAVIDSHRDAENAVGKPIRAPLGGREAEERDWGWWKRLLDVYRTDVGAVSARATATASARDLTRLAIALRRRALIDGRYPANLPAVDSVSATDPLSGEPRVYEVKADGSVELRSNTTREIVRSITPGAQLSYESLYTWVLPAPRGGRVQ